eukprot:c12959_g1_i2.p1 GENE.c12959_g1_i2~~c12959_g1_i2.p1  ORF type:complete len:370 (-),score=124.34 c12959_g1_i2:4-1080(-)
MSKQSSIDLSKQSSIDSSKQSSIDSSKQNSGSLEKQNPKVSKVSIADEVQGYDSEDEKYLNKMKNKLQRDSEHVTEEMVAECQELLKLFGVPYVVSPMEAEAQCATLELLGLVDGIVTNDSDVFLFGGQKIFRNMFHEKNDLECYNLSAIEETLGLNREKLILLALLLGSDYTEGVKGVGIVNSVEIINAFPSFEDLERFGKWVKTLDLTDHQDKSSLTTLEKIFKNKHKRIKHNWELSEGFPSRVVVEAYKNPAVDHSKEEFEWGVPDFDALNKFCRLEFGWDQDKISSYLRPVQDSVKNRDFQTRLDAYFSFNESFAKYRSARMQKALLGISKGSAQELMSNYDPPEESEQIKIKK